MWGQPYWAFLLLIPVVVTKIYLLETKQKRSGDYDLFRSAQLMVDYLNPNETNVKSADDYGTKSRDAEDLGEDQGWREPYTGKLYYYHIYTLHPCIPVYYLYSCILVSIFVYALYPCICPDWNCPCIGYCNAIENKPLQNACLDECECVK
jgi:hypothetical protein